MDFRKNAFITFHAYQRALEARAIAIHDITDALLLFLAYGTCGENRKDASFGMASHIKTVLGIIVH